MALSVSDFDPELCTFNFFRSKDNTQKKIYINYGNTRDSVKIQLCESSPDKMLRTPFGVSEPYQGGTDNGRKSMEVALEDSELGTKLRRLETRLKEYMLEKTQEIFGKKLSMEVIENNFCSPFREVEQSGKSDLLRTKLPESCEILAMHEHDPETQSMKVHKGTPSDIVRNGRCIPSVELTTVWFVARDAQVGYSLTVTNLVVDASKKHGSSQGVSAFIMPPGWQMSIEEIEQPPQSPDEQPAQPADDMGMNFEDNPRPSKLARVATEMNDDPAAYL